MQAPSKSRVPVLPLLALTVAALLIHGYHLGADDAEIYLAGVKKIYDPSLYSFGTEFFLAHEKMSVFSLLLAHGSRLLHLPIETSTFFVHLLGIFALLVASWNLLCLCFSSSRARWTGICMIAAVLSVPVAGTALVIMDPYVTARTLSTPLVMFALGSLLAGRVRAAWLWVLLAALVHPLMSMGAAALLVLLMLPERKPALRETPVPVASALALHLPAFARPAVDQEAYQETVLQRPFLFFTRWQWFEWTGAVVPLAILWVLASVPLRGTEPAFRRLCRALVVLGALGIAVGLLVCTPGLQQFARFQPMRVFHPIYTIFFLLLGGLAGEYLFAKRPWTAAFLFVPLVAGMWYVNYSTYPSSPHVEWPGARDPSPWVTTLRWIRSNTPQDAVFATDPGYILRPGVDRHGFRVLSERSTLADYYKDSGVVSVFPALAGEWKQQVEARSNWDHFTPADYERLAQQYPVTWLLTEQAAPAGFDCPYHNPPYVVCRIPMPPPLAAPGS